MENVLLFCEVDNLSCGRAMKISPAKPRAKKLAQPEQMVLLHPIEVYGMSNQDQESDPAERNRMVTKYVHEHHPGDKCLPDNVVVSNVQ